MAFARSSPPLSPFLRPLLRHYAVPQFLVNGQRLMVHRTPHTPPKAAPFPELAPLQDSLLGLIQASQPTWKSEASSNLLIFTVGSPILLSGLTISGMESAFLLGVLSWRAFWVPHCSGLLCYRDNSYEVKNCTKRSSWHSREKEWKERTRQCCWLSAAACVCALLSISNVGGPVFAALSQLGFVASFCTKQSDTVSSEIGKAYGKTMYLATTFKVVPRGTEGAVSIEGTLAGVVSSILLAGIACSLG